MMTNRWSKLTAGFQRTLRERKADLNIWSPNYEIRVLQKEIRKWYCLRTGNSHGRFVRREPECCIWINPLSPSLPWFTRSLCWGNWVAFFVGLLSFSLFLEKGFTLIWRQFDRNIGPFTKHTPLLFLFFFFCEITIVFVFFGNRTSKATKQNNETTKWRN